MVSIDPCTESSATRTRVAARWLSTVVLAFVIVWASNPTRADEPVAIVEEIGAGVADVQVFDYLRPGDEIALAEGEVLILGYLRSCLRETITGGRVIVGQSESKVENGLIVRQRVECDGGAAVLTAEQAGKSGVSVFRARDRTAEQAAALPLKLYSATPVFTFAEPVDKVVLERLDRSGQAITFDTKGAVLDLAAAGRSLWPGGRYRVSAGDAVRVLEIDARARPNGGPIIGRLVRF